MNDFLLSRAPREAERHSNSKRTKSLSDLLTAAEKLSGVVSPILGTTQSRGDRSRPFVSSPCISDHFAGRVCEKWVPPVLVPVENEKNKYSNSQACSKMHIFQPPRQFHFHRLCMAAAPRRYEGCLRRQSPIAILNQTWRYSGIGGSHKDRWTWRGAELGIPPTAGDNDDHTQL